MNMTFGKLLGGVVIFIVVVLLSLKAATADTVQENCVAAGNVAMKVAEFRDKNYPPNAVVGQLIVAGLPSNTAVQLVLWVYNTPESDRVAIGQWFYSYCMTDAGEPA